MKYAGMTAVLHRDNMEVPLQVPIIVATCGTYLREKGGK